MKVDHLVFFEGGGGGHLPRGGSRNFFNVSSLMDAFRAS